jgi:hypothetical protein
VTTLIAAAAGVIDISMIAVSAWRHMPRDRFDDRLPVQK